MRQAGKTWIVAGMLLLFQSHLSAQKVLPDQIRISRGKCNGECGYGKGFRNISFVKELEYSVADSTLRYRKNSGKPFRVIDADPTFFLQESLYTQLDSLYENFSDYRFSGGKYRVYRIELVYSNNHKWSMPSKVKTMEFIIADDPDKVQPVFIDPLLREYHSLL